MDSPEQKKKLVISSEDLDDSAQGRTAAEEKADPAGDADTRIMPAEGVTIGPKKKAKAAPAPPPPRKPGPKQQGGAPAAAPAGATATPPGGPEPWYRRHSRALLFGGGLVGALAVGFIVAFVLLGIFDSAETRTREGLTASAGKVEETTAGVRRANGAALRFTALSEVAEDSQGRASSIGATASDLSGEVDDAGLLDPALKALNAERRFLAKFGTIASFPENRLRSRWRQLEPELTRARGRIDASREAVLALDLGEEENLMPANAEISAAIATARRIVFAADRKLARWRAQVASAKSELASAESYRVEMEGLIDEYYEQRDVTRTLMNEENVPYFIAEDELEAHAAARQGIIERMEALPVPAGVEGAHANMVNLAARSKAILENAAYTTRTDANLIWTGSQGWQEMSVASDEITAEFEPTEAAVLDAADQAIANLRANQVRSKPRI